MANETQELVMKDQPDGTVLVEGLSLAEPAEAPAAQPAESAEEPQDTRLSEEQHVDGDETEQAGETAEEAEARRERNRQRKLQNKERRQSYIESLKRELASRDALLNEVTQRLSLVERKSNGAEMARVDEDMRQTADAYAFYKDQVGKAVESANGQLHADALEKMQAAQQRYNQLQAVKQAMTAPRQQPRALDPRLVSHAQEWLGRNKWYDQTGTDPDSSITMAIDDSLVREGWNPTTKEYWEELDARIGKYLPHRTSKAYNREKQGQDAPRVPVSGAGNPGGGNTPSNQFRLSPARVQAMKDAGIWEDPKKRADMIRRYADQDRNSGR